MQTIAKRDNFSSSKTMFFYHFSLGYHQVIIRQNIDEVPMRFR